jgi:hypothetical protein
MTYIFAQEIVQGLATATQDPTSTEDDDVFSKDD